MHIGDFEYPPDDFKVWCSAHISQAEPGAVVFTLLKRDNFREYKKGWSCAILGPEVGGDGDNAPNIAGEFSESTLPLASLTSSPADASVE